MKRILRWSSLAMVLLGIGWFAVSWLQLEYGGPTEYYMRGTALGRLGSLHTHYEFSTICKEPFDLDSYFRKVGSSLAEAESGSPRYSPRYEHPVSHPPNFPGQRPVLVGFYLVSRPDVRFYLLEDGAVIEWLPKVREARVIQWIDGQPRCNTPVIHVP